MGLGKPHTLRTATMGSDKNPTERRTDSLYDRVVVERDDNVIILKLINLPSVYPLFRGNRAAALSHGWP